MEIATAPSSRGRRHDERAMGDDTVSVTATVLSIKRVDSGRLLALASVEILIAGVAFTLQGVRVVRTGPRSRGVASPSCRVANGRLAAAVALPPELARAIADVVLDAHDALRCPPPPPLAREG